MAAVQAGILEPDLVNPGGFPQLLRFVRGSWHPELSPEFLHLTLKATLTTLAYAACGTCLSILLGVVAGVVTSEIWWLTVWPHWTLRQPIWLFIRGLLAFPRAIHEMIWGIFFVSIWGLDPLVAIMAIAIPYGAIVAKIFSEILDETPRDALMALLSSGVSPLTAFVYSLIPQAFSHLLSYSLYRFECSVRSATVLGLVGAGGLGYEMLLSLQSLRYEQLWTFFYTLVLLNGLIDISSVILRRWINFRIVLILVVLCCWSFWYISPDVSKFWSPRTQQLLGEIAQASFPLNFQ
ncbi:MAG: ABC transporter permease subunit, partial [Symploca sp. SIO3E6]|nr:ABC transporter permease subunit [Caldora sp. SIO3E6]